MVRVTDNPLTDDDCGEGELVDLVTGQCARACANGWRLAAGLCPFGWLPWCAAPTTAPLGGEPPT